MNRQTSHAAYEEIRARGLLSEMRLNVYSYLYRNGPMTAGELAAGMMRSNEPHPSYHRRLHELEKLGVAFRHGERPCRVTGFNAEVWDVNDKLPSGTITPTGGKPTKQEFGYAFAELAGIYNVRLKAGQPFTKNLIEVLAWLRKRHA
jgi:hypothetical protein